MKKKCSHKIYTWIFGDGMMMNLNLFIVAFKYGYSFHNFFFLLGLTLYIRYKI